MDINAQDTFGFTPLHWAVQTSKEMSLNYLMSMNANPNIQETQYGYTPLHLAILGVDSLRSTRIVRFLMIRGADITIKDHKGRVPANLISEIKDKKMRDELYRAMVIIFVLFIN